MSTKKIYLKNSEEALLLLGRQDENIRNIENLYGVQIFARQDAGNGMFTLSVRGRGAKVDKAIADIELLRDNCRGKNDIISAYASKNETDIGNCLYTSYSGRIITPRSANQKKYIESIFNSDMVFAIGPAGTGKTFLAAACALKMLRNGGISKIVITRPVVEAGEKLGFLPGDLYEKINPYLRPLYDAFYYMLGAERFHALKDDGTIEIAPLAYMRGRTIEKAFIILDEAQNVTTEQMKMFLTRMGVGSKIIVSGDRTQIDISSPKNSGLLSVEKILKNIDEISFVYFDKSDIVRHKLVKQIVKAYEGKNEQ
ncbi:MAG: PhoH family protein [Endomicrobium sp.]|jgi:phosphate starvation-inducible PhoH-like protein|nr:PhoH family protein [Endomicrobium sp.]